MEGDQEQQNQQNVVKETPLTRHERANFFAGLNAIGQLSTDTRDAVMGVLIKQNPETRKGILSALTALYKGEGRGTVFNRAADANATVENLLKQSPNDIVKTIQGWKKRDEPRPVTQHRRRPGNNHDGPMPPPNNNNMEELEKRLDRLRNDMPVRTSQSPKPTAPSSHTARYGPDSAPRPQQQKPPLENPPVDENYPNLRPPPTQYQTQEDDQNFQQGLNSTLDDIDINMSDNSSKGKQVPEEIAKGVFQTFYEKASEIGMGMAMYALFLPALFSLMAEGFSIDPDAWFDAIGANFDPETATDDQLDEIEDRANEMLQQRGSGHRVELVRSTRRRRRRRIVENITQLTQIEL